MFCRRSDQGSDRVSLYTTEIEIVKLREKKLSLTAVYAVLRELKEDGPRLGVCAQQRRHSHQLRNVSQKSPDDTPTRPVPSNNGLVFQKANIAAAAYRATRLDFFTNAFRKKSPLLKNHSAAGSLVPTAHFIAAAESLAKRFCNLRTRA